MLIGGIAGYAQGDDSDEITFFWSSAEDKALGGGVLGALLGAAGGSVIGSIKKRFKINGRLASYHLERENMKKYLYSNP